MNKILIPTDFSSYSNFALEYASFIANEKGAKLFILHVISSSSKGIVFAQKKFEEIKEFDYLKGIDYEVIIEEGHIVSKAINRVGIAHDINLVIMGSKGVSSIEEMILGSCTENVIRKSHFNVLVLKHKMNQLKIDNILFPSDFSSEAFSIFEKVKEFAILFNAKIYFLIVNIPNHNEHKSTIKSKMNKLIKFYKLDENNINYERIITNDKTKELGVLNASIDYNIDLIAIGSHGKNILKKLIHESISLEIVRDSFKPILTIRF